jgi:uncharacterized protein YgbK (DUF1537 family)
VSGPVLRLLADDLTGALDSAAEFAGLAGPVPVLWPIAAPAGLRGPAALDAATREVGREAAMARTAALAPALDGADIAFRKIDSLLRGHVAAELASCLRAGPWRSLILAPAFPAQGRITRGVTQLARAPDGAWRPVGAPIPELLRAEGLDSQPGRPGQAPPPGITVFNAETEAELVQVVETGRMAPGPLLWCGSGGLARALAGAAPAPRGDTLRPPVLGLFGSDQAPTARQLAACGGAALRVQGEAEAPRIAEALTGRGVALVSLDLPQGLPRAQAARRIHHCFGALTQRLPRPGTLLAAGGETLRGLCDALGASALEAVGLVLPGVPRSVLRGGRWDGTPVISKSGAFGADGIWRDLLTSNGLPRDMHAA